MSEDVRRVFNPRAEFTAEDGDLGMAGAWCPPKDPEKFYAIMPWENYESLRAVVAGVHEAIGESDASDDESLPEVVGEIFTSLRARITELEDHPIWSSDHDQKYLELLAKKDRRIARLRSALERHAPDILDDLESVKSSGARR